MHTADVTRSRSSHVNASVSHGVSGRILCLDGWRGMCIVIVLVAHFFPMPFVDWGDLGVDLFFVLSGRLMAHILFEDRPPLLTFYVRRFSRVWPALLVYVLCCLVAFEQSVGFLHVGAGAAAAALTFTTNYKAMFLGQTQLLDHTWSLCVEEHSYLALGIIALLGRGTSMRVIEAVILGLAVAMACNGIAATLAAHASALTAVTQGGFDLYWRSDVRGASVFFAAFVYLRSSRSGARLPAWMQSRHLAAAALLMAIPAYALAVPRAVHFTVGTALIAVAVCRVEAMDRRYVRLLKSRVLVAFGTYSFSIYVWQQLMFKLFQDMREFGGMSRLEGVLTRPLFVIGACLLGVASFHLVEKPARRWINLRWATLSATRATT